MNTAKIRTELSDGELSIRRYCAEDIPLLFEAARESVYEMSAWMPWCHKDYSIEESKAFILSREQAWQQKTEYDFAVYEVANKKFLGGVGLNRVNLDNRFANLGYWVRSSHTKRGVATRAAGLAARFGFEDLGLHRIEIIAAAGNKASQRVAEKAGAKKEGVLRNRLLLANQLHDAVMYSLIATDWNI